MPVDSEALLEESGWVRALARRLAADHQRAEDLAQETLVAALQRPRKEGVPLRRWLAAVMRNLWQQERRGELRRTDREARASLSEAEGAEPTPDLVARLEAHRAVVDAVLALHEPYRSVLVARYFDGLAPRAIAQQRGLPVRTVHTQLARALALLRARLERAHGGAHGAWLPILGLLMGVDRPGGLVGTALGALAMDVKVKVAVGVVALAGLTFVARPLWNAARPAEVASVAAIAPTVPEAPRAPAQEPGDARALAVDAHEVVREAPQARTPAPVAAAAGLLVRAVDVDLQPVEGLAVRCSGTEDVVLTDADGVATLPCSTRDARLEVVDARWILVSESLAWNFDPEARNDVVVARRIELSGRVVDDAGTPLAGAQVRVFLPFDAAGALRAAPGDARLHTWTTEADVGGEFRLEAGVLPGGMLVARQPGHRTELRAQPTSSDVAMQLELPRLQPNDDLLAGLVVDAAGAPVEGARVALGYDQTRSDAHGRFLIRLSDRDDIGVLSALAPGSLPARLERAMPSSRDPGAWPDPLILRLGGPPLAIRGRVLDAAGDPVADARVRVLDPTHFGAVEWGDVEGVTILGFVEALLCGQVSQLEVETDANGAFTLEGLLPRAYRLTAIHEASLSHVELGPVQAGVGGLVLRLPAVELRPRLAGRVLGLDGTPLAGVSVTLVGRVPEVSATDAPAHVFRAPMYGASRRTDAEGGFTFEDVPVDALELQVFGPGLDFGQQFAVGPGDDPEDLELRVARSCAFEVDLTDSGVSADRLAVLDPDGERLGIAISLGDKLMTGDETGLTGGRSGPLSVSERARTLVLFRDDAEVLRRELQLVPGELTVVRP